MKHSYILCILLHISLVVMSVVLVWLTMARKEHNITFSIDYQEIVSFWCRIVTTVFATRSAILHSTKQFCTLTEMHDQISAWGGIGAAVSILYTQVTLPSSFLRIFWICLYLSTISVLNVTTPALVSVESFNFSISTTVKTQSIPQWSTSGDRSTLLLLQNNAAFLPWIDHLDQAKKLGLSKGSLYDVMVEAYPGSEMADISAMGFNISCGYIPSVLIKEVHPESLGMPLGAGVPLYNISFPTEGLNTIVMGNTNLTANEEKSEPDKTLEKIVNPKLEVPADSIILYTQNPISDTNGKIGHAVKLPNLNVTLQFLQCSDSVVLQMGKVDTGSRKIIPNSLHPTVYKNHSSWRSYNPFPKAANSTSLLEGDYWAQILSGLDDPQILVTTSGKSFNGWGTYESIDWGSMYLMQQLGLEPSLPSDDGGPIKSSAGQLLYLHDIENAVSNLVASIFWTGGHIHPSSIAMKGIETTWNIGHIYPPILSTGNTTVERVVFAVRLNAAIGLGASMLLLILAIMFSAGTHSSNPHLSSMGFLQIIWVFEHHPELLEILEQVEDPTDYNLRAAGLVKVRLFDAIQLEQEE
ncbi:hypothetical protein DFH08DRAFT_940256 [Mycena albidolilacea]|uniref:Uncharacterized protein n=1 Tax=Mycena albidolilacea TaxID=1033008 RepID=A0AAD6ZNU3_9AGAR|nr:hypothetical protein DFH08DRAFT_940256 [Mycena albidolilacea]